MTAVKAAKPKTKTSFLRSKNFLALIYLVKVLRRKRSNIVKPKDLERFLSFEDHGLKTVMGRVLNALVRAGLAHELRSSRPRSYMIELGVASRICDYGFKCFFNGDCPYLGSCPIREAVREVVKQ